MPYPISSLLPRVEPHLEGWLDAHRRARISTLAASLKPVWDWGCYEARLMPGAERIDFAVRAFPGAVGKKLMAGSLCENGDFQGRQGVADFLRGWSEPGTLLHDLVPHTWLEYDIPDGRVRDPFVSLSFVAGDDAEKAGAVAPDTLGALTRLGQELLGQAPDPSQVEAVVRCARALPDAGRIVHVAPLPAWRGQPDLRIVAYLPCEETGPWLRRIRWPGRKQQLATALRLVGRRLDWQHVNLDLGRPDHGDVLKPVIGLQFDPPSLPSMRRQWWEEFLEPLVEGGLCDPLKARLTLDWDHQEYCRPDDAEWLLEVIRNGYAKVVVDEEGEVDVKVYLCFHSRYVLWPSPTNGTRSRPAIDATPG